MVRLAGEEQRSTSPGVFIHKFSHEAVHILDKHQSR